MDTMGRTVGRDPFESEAEAQARADEPMQAGPIAGVSWLPLQGGTR